MKNAFLILVLAASLLACSQNQNSNQSLAVVNQKIGVLFVNHGSRSETWRQALLDLETHVKDSILENGWASGTKTAFMEYTEPSIATRLKEFDTEGYTDIILVPVFLTVSPHSFDDIPTILGQKEDPQSLETLKIEKIERYTPKAQVHITPLLDFTDVLKKNILTRTKALSTNPEQEGLVLMAYGDETYTKEWSTLLTNVGEFVGQNTGINKHSYGWCGHIAHYNPDSTTVAINRVLKEKKIALVVPVLVAHDEMFQVNIIGDGIAQIENSTVRVRYKADSILPDPGVEAWVLSVVAEFSQTIKNQSTVAIAP